MDLAPDVDWLVWGVWASGRATLKELHEDWSYVDALEAHLVLQFEADEKKRILDRKNG